jgi:DNA-binding IclR family transcriptional regulator
MNSSDRLLAVLGLFSEDCPEWTAEEMTQATGFTRPTLYRYLKSLREAGLLTSVSGGVFSLGPRVTELDYLMRRADPLIAAGQHALHTLSKLHPCSAFLVRWYGRKILCVSSVVSATNPQSSYPRGRPMPLARGAISRSILAHLSKRKQEDIGGTNLAEFSRVGFGDTAEEIRANLRKTRREGVAIAHGEVTPGVVGIAAPIFDGGVGPAAALCFTAVEEEIRPEKITLLSVRVRDLAHAISAELTGAERTRKSA